MVRQRKSLAALLFLLGVGLSLPTIASAQLPWRGHYVRRDGLFHVEKMHWGGGITPTGGAVLTSGINAFAPVVGGLLVREVPFDDRSGPCDDREMAPEVRTVTRSVLPEEYIVEQRRANDLLARTAALVGYQTTAPCPPAPPLTPPIGDPDRGTPATEREFGRDPWKARP